jgi:penicillin-binding protein 1A
MKMWAAPHDPRGGRGGGRGGPLHPAGGPRRRGWVTALKWLVIAGLTGAILIVGTVAFVLWMYGRDPSLPALASLADYRPKQVIKILDRDGRVVGELLGPDKIKERRTFVPFEQLPPIVATAFVAAEDNRFWTHSGIDYWGMFRAFLANLRSGKAKQGASTITQQVVKTFLLTPEKTFKRKIQEIILARRLEKALTKQEILTLYVNQINFGNARYGVQEAARFYFGKDVGQLDVGEAAVLAGIPQRPEALAPNRKENERAAKARQVYVLNQLVEMGALRPAEAQKWIDAPIRVVKAPGGLPQSAQVWVDLAREELVDELERQGRPESALDTLGGTVRTTLDPKLQEAAQLALQRGLRAVDKRKGTGRPKRAVRPGRIDAEIAALAGRLGRGGPRAREVYDAVVTAVHDELGELEVDLGRWPAAVVLGGDDDERLNPPGEGGARKRPSERFAPGDVIEVTLAAAGAPKAKGGGRRVELASGPEGAVVIIEVKSRRVRALVGGYSSKRGDFNRATMARRQPGSTFKPFVYAAAIAARKATAGGRPGGGPYLDAPQVYDLWRPKNYDSKFDGPVLLRTALAKSINTVAIRVTHDVGPAAVAELARRMGVGNELPREMAISLGAGEVTPLELTNAMATFAAGGRAAAPRFLETVGGKGVAAPTPVQALDEKTAYIVTDLMRSVVTAGTGHLARELRVPIAGKTGTSNDAKDTWFIGLTPDYAIGVWIGYDDPRAMGREAGGTTAVPVFVDVAKAMRLPDRAFPRPSGILDVKIDRATGDLAPEGAPPETVATELYLEGTQPTVYAAKPGDVTDQNVVTSEFEEN